MNQNELFFNSAYAVGTVVRIVSSDVTSYVGMIGKIIDANYYTGNITIKNLQNESITFNLSNTNFYTK